MLLFALSVIPSDHACKYTMVLTVKFITLEHRRNNRNAFGKCNNNKKQMIVVALVSREPPSLSPGITRTGHVTSHAVMWLGRL